MEQDVRDFAAAILVDQSGRLLFQRRDNIPGIVHPGKVALFGGRREAGETPLQCIVREVFEEISFRISAEDFEFLISLHGADPEMIARRVRGELFIARDVPSSNLMVTEGTLVVVHPSELSGIRSDLTPMTLIAVKAFLRGSPRPA